MMKIIQNEKQKREPTTTQGGTQNTKKQKNGKTRRNIEKKNDKRENTKHK